MADSTLIYSDSFEGYSVGTKPSLWFGDCVVGASGLVISNVTTNGLVIGDSTTGSTSVRAPYPRLDACVPVSYDNVWSIGFAMKVQYLSSVFTSSTTETPLTWATIGSIDKEDKLKLQVSPEGYMMIYPYTTTEKITDCGWRYYKIEMWDTYFNFYIDDMNNPVIQQAIPASLPYWKAGDNRIAMTFPLTGLHRIVIDEFTFSTSAALPSDVFSQALCFAIRDSNNDPVVSAPAYLIPTTTAANQVTDSYGRFSIAEIPSNVDVLFVEPDLTTKLILASDITLAKQRRLISGVDEYSNIDLDSTGVGVANARMYYIDPNAPSFYTDENGKIARTSVGSGYHCVVKTTAGESVYLDATLFD